ncbi:MULTISPECIES: hypothetical protein [unclassified Pseudomonas]|uniref:hypothetical protein n=1 Tax=Pseudomonas TaxID=286 RepID=UPI0011AF08D8|nr:MULTISPECIES: hypothetical protein [unclassified Pseudomonas]
MRTDPASPKAFRPNRPRQYARLILAAGDDLARDVLLSKVPADWLELVQAHVSQGEAHIQQHVLEQEKLRPSVTLAGPAIADYREPAHIPGNAVIAARHLNALRASLNSSRANP